MIRVLNNENFKSEIENSDKVVIVDFFATWCGPCKMLTPVFEELSNSMTDVDFVKVDIDQSLRIAQEYNITSVPTMMIFKNGKPVDTIMGFVPKQNIENKLRMHL
ncbi:thioredoxin [Romboutsia lituseburensis]|uniref:Thioredoxin n=1 Tax=Romboutsia lituseburensis DSM 797 TaxID=1121325 RepID=A0A1G9SG95_9FIRM|nr:thioredoxin [Romboutsia lituseburensis]CEH35886.1 Thioredoxin [Romboutsia lituseburensis]SDM33785.1 thioredoxin [Romboutsia lituseburensis DSM 797]